MGNFSKHISRANACGFLLAGALLLGHSAAMADGPSFSYIQANYQEVNVDLGGGLDVDGDGYGVAGSAELGDNWFIFANYSTFNFESVLDISELTAGVGYHAPVSAKTDWFASVAYAKAEVDLQGFGSDDDSGYAAALGIRSMVSESLELYGKVSYADLGDGLDGTSFGAGLWYTVSGNLALGIAAEFDDDATAYGAGIRLYFD